MSATQINLTGLIRQPEGGYQMDNTFGGWKGTVVWRCARSSALSLAPTKLSAHPDNGSLLCTDCKITEEEGDVSKIEATFEGLAPGDATSLPPVETELSATTSEQPIETHDLIKYLTNAQRNEVQIFIQRPESSIDTPVPTGWIDDQVLYYNWLTRGITSYLVPGMVFTRSYVSTSRPTSAKVGTISKPPEAPSILGDWLKLGTTYKRSGGYYQVTESWQASGKTKWDPLIYG